MRPRRHVAEAIGFEGGAPVPACGYCLTPSIDPAAVVRTGVLALVCTTEGGGEPLCQTEVVLCREHARELAREIVAIAGEG